MSAQRKAYPGGYRPKSNGDKGKFVDYVSRAKVKPTAVGSSVVTVQMGSNRQPIDRVTVPKIVPFYPEITLIPKDSKFCINCGDWVKRDGFSPDKRSRDGLHTWCKSCRNEQARRIYWHEKHSAAPSKAA